MARLPEAWDYKELRIMLRMSRPDRVQLTWADQRWGMTEEEVDLPVCLDEARRALEAVGRSSQAVALRKGTLDRLDPMRDIGERLFAVLFGGQREGDYRRWQAMAQAERQGLRLRLLFDQAELAAMPWEFLHDGKDYLVLSASSPVVRSVPADLAPLPPPSRPGLRALILAPAQADVAETEPRLPHPLLDALKRLTWRFPDFHFLVVWERTREKFLAAIARTNYPFEMLHIVGTAGELKPGQPVLWLKDAAGRPAPLGAQQLVQALGEQPELRAVYLNVGAADGLALELARVCPAVLSLRAQMSEEAEVPFTEALYAGLLAGAPLEAALAQGRQEVGRVLPGSREWGLPALYLAADGRLFAPAWRGPSSSESTDVEAARSRAESPERRKIRALLTLRRKNLEALQEQAMAYSSIPGPIQQQIETLQGEIARLEQDLESAS